MNKGQGQAEKENRFTQMSNGDKKQMKASTQDK